MNRKTLAGSALALALAVLATVGNGDEVDREDFPATCEFDAEGKEPCSCVLVGPEALLTAAHCMTDNDKTGAIGIFMQPPTRTGKCEVDRELDLALCPVSASGDILFERIRSTPLTEGEGLLLTGFGCLSRLLPNPPQILRMDRALVSALPGSDNFIEFEDGWLCSGDSGGPTFSLESVDDHLSPRFVVGINSENFHLASVSTEAARRFISGWAKDNNVGVCGIRESRDLRCRE
jgi:hypothetical protein